MALRESSSFETSVCVTGQHREMLDQVLEVFNIVPDTDLQLMRPDQTLAGFTSLALTAVDGYLREVKPGLILVQGDTTTTFAASLAAFYNGVKVGHVEAGLRTGNKHSPFPEEINRSLTTHLADFHFAPTEWAAGNLRQEGVAEEKIFVTGNTVIDALMFAVEKVRQNLPAIDELPEDLFSDGGRQKPLVLITGHRRESFGDGFQSICKAISELASMYPETAFVYPVHLNPHVRRPVFDILGGKDNVHLIGPLSYLPFVRLMDRASLILTDSGGMQEEAPSLGKPVLVMRDTTERPEAVEAGTAKLVGTDMKRIVENVSKHLDNNHAASIQNKNSPYGDGKASKRIIESFIHAF